MAEFREAEAYENNSSKQREDGKNLIGHLSPEKGNNILDLGCGTGHLTKVLADLVGPTGKVVGIDPDVERLDIACTKYSASNIEYLEGRGKNIPGCDYDMVYSNYVIHWCEDKDLIFKQVHKCLKRGGKFGFVAISGNCVDEVCKAGMVSSEFEEVARNMMVPVSLDGYVQLARDNKFEVVYKKDENRVWKYSDVYQYIEVLRTDTHGQFDITHFNVDAIQRHFQGREIALSIPFCTVVCRAL